MDETQAANKVGREALENWQADIHQNIYSLDKDFIHTIKYIFSKDFKRINAELEKFGIEIPNKLEPLVAENHEPGNLPRLESYDEIGRLVEKVVHHPSYVQAGDIIYKSKLMEKLAKPGGLAECLSLFFLSGAAGEAGHNCPIACSAGIIRVLNKVPNFPNKALYLEKLMSPSYQTNFTGAQFVTEVQGGSDVGLTATYAEQDDNNVWRIYGEKWFCSNAGADLIFVAARYNKNIPGTKGIGLFLVPAIWDNLRNNYTLRRLKEKFGTRTLATAEIDFHGAYAIPMGDPQDGFRLLMENVLHISRLFNTFVVLGMARRAYSIVHAYAKNRIAFSNPIINYPLIKENLAKMKAENTAMIAAAFDTARMQDQADHVKNSDKNTDLLLRLLVNIQKYLSALWSVEHIHHALGILAGNGAIETFSSIPRLFSDSIVCENWEGTHNVLRMQVLKDILKYDVDQIYFSYMQTELQKLKEPSYYSNLIAEKLKKLKQHITDMRKLDPSVQALQIRVIVDRMAILYCALRLLFEAQDQMQKASSNSKLDCLQYFCLLHLNKEEIDYDQDYLNLISRIIQL